MKLPDQLLVRYYRGSEIDAITQVEINAGVVTVTLGPGDTPRTDRWTDLGGGLGYVPADTAD